jgi:GDSL/SGNH-like Acyl-Esterase family found in Pmr5 and Cas1p
MVGITLLESQEHRRIFSKLNLLDKPPVHAPIGRLLLERLSAFNHRPDDVAPFAQESPHPTSGLCRYLRGKVGHWTQDMKYAEGAQYRIPLRHYSGNAEKLFQRNAKQGVYGDMKYRPPTTYRWEETRYDQCQPSLMTRENVCEILPSMGIQRIFVLGDSLNLQMAQSIWMMLTTEEAGDSPTPPGTLEPNFESLISCSSGFQIKIVFVRNDELLENDLPVSLDEETKNCHTYCYPWTQKYLNDQVKTVLFVNAGAHIHQFDLFTSMVDRFVTVFDGMQRPDDIVLFRTLVPGHWDCSRTGLAPFNSFDEFMKDSEAHQSPQDEAVYGWDKFTPYNDYAVNVLNSRRSQQSHIPRALMEVVDVYPTTVLRPDGHCSDEYRLPKYSTTDCLHYSLPGPVDWWSHLAFSHLVDIGRQQSSQFEELQTQHSKGNHHPIEQHSNQYSSGTQQEGGLYQSENVQQSDRGYFGLQQHHNSQQWNQQPGEQQQGQDYQQGYEQAAGPQQNHQGNQQRSGGDQFPAIQNSNQLDFAEQDGQNQQSEQFSNPQQQQAGTQQLNEKYQQEYSERGRQQDQDHAQGYQQQGHQGEIQNNQQGYQDQSGHQQNQDYQQDYSQPGGQQQVNNNYQQQNQNFHHGYQGQGGL